MKGKIISGIIVILLISAPSLLSQKEKIIDIASERWMPYSGVKDINENGYTVDIFRAIFEPKGYRIRYRVIPYARIIKMLEKGEIDVTTAVPDIHGPNVPAFYKTMLFPKEKIGVAEYLFVIRKGDKWRYNGIDSMKNRKLGILNTGNWYREKPGERPSDDNNFINIMTWYVKRSFQKKDNMVEIVSGADGITTAINMLANGRFDCFVEERSSAIYHAKKAGVLDRISFTSAGMPAVDVRPAFSKKKKEAEELATIYDKGMREIRKSGELKKILERYGLKEWK